MKAQFFGKCLAPSLKIWPSSDVSNSSLTHFSSFLFTCSKWIPYCLNSPGSFKETTFEASKTICFFDRVSLRITESIFQLLYITYSLLSPIFEKWLVWISLQNALHGSGTQFLLAAGSVSFWSRNLVCKEKRYKGAVRLPFGINKAETSIYSRVVGPLPHCENSTSHNCVLRAFSCLSKASPEG